MKKNITFFTGAGISAESGIQTFRDSNGLWENHKIEDVATPRAWAKNPELVLQFYNARRKKILHSQPNIAHYEISLLQKEFNVQVITQNIDDLHERAGSQNILHLHGEIFKMRSEKNLQLIYEIKGDIHIGETAQDGAQLRPHIVWFEEAVPNMDEAIFRVQKSDLFIVIGTSLVVQPAASLLHYLPQNTPIIVIDKKIPHIHLPNVHSIEKSACESIDDLKKLISILL